MTASPTEGTPAPDFSLPSDGGATVSLAALKGRKVVLYFYPKADTPGCTKESIDFSRLKPEFSRAGADVIGVSADAVAAQDKFKAKHDLTIPLASDPDRSMIERYGVWGEKSMYGKKFMGIERTTFLIDGTGVIRKVWHKVKVEGHAEEVLAAAKAL
ncbi:MAG TPA: peroxiredoxin [Xanthobacteraceae bacterium]|nr:peroxiredoxin [Xanthobacteraceae bacterium]